MAILSLFGGFVLGAFIINFTGDTGFVGRNVITFASAVAIYKMSARLVGFMLEKINLLPRGASRYYPEGTSWGSYLRKTGRM